MERLGTMLPVARHIVTRTFKYGISVISSAVCTLSTNAHSLSQSDCTAQSHRDFSIHQVPVTSAHLVCRDPRVNFLLYKNRALYM
jgi:hypothetical protein